MDASNNEELIDAPDSETNVSDAEQEVNTSEELDFDDLGKPKSDGKVEGINGYLSRLNDETREEKFYSQPLQTRDALRKRFPEQYGNYKENLEIDDREELFSEFEKRQSAKQEKEAFKSKIDSLKEDDPEFFKSHGAKLKTAINESLDSGSTPLKALKEALGELALKGIMPNAKAIQEAEKRGKIRAGQSISTSNYSDNSDVLNEKELNEWNAELKKVGVSPVTLETFKKMKASQK